MMGSGSPITWHVKEAVVLMFCVWSIKWVILGATKKTKYGNYSSW